MILLLGGTIDSRQIATQLSEHQRPFIVTTVSDYGLELALEVSASAQKASLDPHNFLQFLKDNQISAVIDATHPFARAASDNAMAAAAKAGISYYRFERPPGQHAADQNLILAKDLLQAQEMALAMPEAETVLLTTGSRGLPSFRKLIAAKKVYARVLPDAGSITACEQAGLPTGQIIAMQGPFSYEANALLIKEKKIDLLITKESGTAGGTEQKIAAARDAGIKSIVITRPEITYPVVFDDIDALITTILEGEIHDEQARI